MTWWHPQVLVRLRGTTDVDAEFADIQEAVTSARAGSRWALFTTRRYLPQLFFSILLPIVQQYTGINAYMFYAVRPPPCCCCSSYMHPYLATFIAMHSTLWVLCLFLALLLRACVTLETM